MMGYGFLFGILLSFTAVLFILVAILTGRIIVLRGELETTQDCLDNEREEYRKDRANLYRYTKLINKHWEKGHALIEGFTICPNRTMIQPVDYER